MTENSTCRLGLYACTILSATFLQVAATQAESPVGSWTSFESHGWYVLWFGFPEYEEESTSFTLKCKGNDLVLYVIPALPENLTSAITSGEDMRIELLANTDHGAVNVGQTSVSLRNNEMRGEYELETSGTFGVSNSDIEVIGSANSLTLSGNVLTRELSGDGFRSSAKIWAKRCSNM